MRILFICTGNVSRSPVAECILRTMAEQAGRNDITVASAGVRVMPNQPYDPQMVATAARHGYVLEGCSKPMTDEMIRQADLILVMDFYQYVEVQKYLPYSQWHKLKLLNQYCHDEDTGIEDPYYYDDMYELVFSKIEACCYIILQNEN